MSPLEIKLLHGETAVLQFLDSLIDRHPGYVALAIGYLLLMAAVLVIVNVARRRAKGLIKPGPRIILVEPVNAPPRLAEPTYVPFPPMRDSDYEYERLIDPEFHED